MRAGCLPVRGGSDTLASTMQQPSSSVDPVAEHAERDAPDLAAYAAAIRASFAELEAVEPLTLLSDGLWLETVETTGGAVFRFAKDETSGAWLAKEERLLPFLRGHLSATIPIPEWYASTTGDFPWGFSGHPRVAGAALLREAINERNEDHLATSIARFLSELHRFPVDRALALEVEGGRSWRASYDQLRRRVMPALRHRLTFSERAKVRRWWRGFLDEERLWSFDPTLVHGTLRDGRLLVNARLNELVGVVGWERARVADAAVDFAELIEPYGSDFVWRVIEAYRDRGVAVDGDLFMRVRRLSAANVFRAVDRARRLIDGDSGDRESGEASMNDAITALRASPILNH